MVALSAGGALGCASANALGTSRTIAIDTRNGPGYGSVQYGDKGLLRHKEVVLTFDDGPSNTNTPLVLNALRRHCTQATFFLVGRMARAYPKIARQILRDGHTVGTHTWSHENLQKRSASLGRNQIERGIAAISKALRRPPAPFFRFPYLAHTRALLRHARRRDLAVFSIDIDAVDFRTRNPDRMHRNVMRALERRGRGIILFHDIQRSTALGLPRLLRTLKARGYKVVHLIPKRRGAPAADLVASRRPANERPLLAAAKAEPPADPLRTAAPERKAAPPADPPRSALASIAPPVRKPSSRPPRQTQPSARVARVNRRARATPRPVARPAPAAAAKPIRRPAWQRRALFNSHR
ncbi:MAG: polysaccharide deacetylase family protein [Pseudomonadota bacterium]